MVSLRECLAPSFFTLHHNIKSEVFTDYYLKGGRGSTKSTFPSIEILLGLEKDPLANAIAVMKVGTMVETGVFAQLQWAMDKLNLTEYWKPNHQKYYFTNKRTGQRIYCKGCDEAAKFKSIKLVKGYFKYQWFEELDQFDGMEEIRKAQQSLTRAGLDFAIRFYSYNPPKTVDHWLNRYIIGLAADIAKGLVKQTIIHHSTYLSVPKEWLGKQFITDAETLKVTHPKAYQHEYMGEITGTGGQVFTNVVEMPINEEKISTFGYILRGLDWGFAVDPTSHHAIWYDRNHHDLYIFKEVYEYGISLDNLAIKLRAVNPKNGLIRADSAEPRSNSEMQQRGFNITPVVKGPGSVDHGLKWMQGLNHIYIDSIRCPNAYREFVGYEYEQDKNGNFKSSYPDKNNHAIDDVRYALEDVIRGGIGKITIKR